MSEKINILAAYDEHTTEAKSDSYPYGRLRCQAKWWIEDNGKKGHRVCFQTINPKTGRVNAPKKGTYHLVAVLVTNPENGHVESHSVNPYQDSEKIEEFLNKYNLREKDEKFLRAYLEAKHKFDEKMAAASFSFTIKTSAPIQVTGHQAEVVN